MPKERSESTLKAGHRMAYDTKARSLIWFDKNDARPFRWYLGDRKGYAPFIKTKDEFFDFLLVLARTHGLRVVLRPEKYPGFPWGMYEFTEEKRRQPR